LAQAAIGVGVVSPETIDQIGIDRAWAQAMAQAIGRLPVQPKLVLIDGQRIPKGIPIDALPVVRGDGRSLVIAAASIVAKVVRDRMMMQLHQLLPEYRFAQHKGYGTAEHLKILKTVGPSAFHRFSFRPIRIDE